MIAQGLVLQDSLHARSDPEIHKSANPRFEGALDLRSTGGPVAVMLNCSAASGLACSALQRIHPLLRSLNMKQRVYFWHFKGASLVLFFSSRMKAIIQAKRTSSSRTKYSAYALSPRSPGKHAHGECAKELSQTIPCSDTTPQQRS